MQVTSNAKFKLDHPIASSSYVDRVMNVLETRKLSLDSLQKIFGEPSASFASKAEIADLFPDCDPTAIPPFGHLYDIGFYFAKELFSLHDVTFCVQPHATRIALT